MQSKQIRPAPKGESPKEVIRVAHGVTLWLSDTGNLCATLVVYTISSIILAVILSLTKKLGSSN